MSCFCLSAKSRVSKDDGINPGHVSDFFKVALGDPNQHVIGDVSAQVSIGKLDEFNAVNGSSNAENTDFSMYNNKTKITNLAKVVSPLVLDAIRRKASLGPIAQALNNTGNRDLQGVTGRDLFVATALSCSDTVRLYSMASLIPGMALPLVVPNPSAAEPLVLWDAFADLLCFPRGPLIVSVGTEESRGLGKTTLLRSVGLCGMTKPYDVLGGKLGCPSVDIYIPGNSSKTGSADEGLDTVIADCSGLPMTDATVAALVSAAAVAIVHIYPRDVSDKAGPSRELKEMLGSGQCKRIVVLIRDVDRYCAMRRGITVASFGIVRPDDRILVSDGETTVF